MNEEPNIDSDPTALNGRWRVKLYHLNQQGQWMDFGTGFVFISHKVHLFYNASSRVNILSL